MKKLVLALLLTTVGYAGIAAAASGPYVQLQGGIGGLDTKSYSANNRPYSKVELRDSASYRLSAGYLLGEGDLNYGLEVGYTNYPTNSYQINAFNWKQSYSGHNFDLLGVAKYNFSGDEGLFVEGKAGAAYVSQTYKVKTNVINSSSTVHEVKPEAGLGVGYNFNKNLSLDVSYSHVFGDTTNPINTKVSERNNVASVNTLMAGLSYHFG